MAVVLLVSGFVIAVFVPVSGMIESFNEIAGSDGTASPESLADGISKSLLTAVWGILHIALGILLLVVRLVQRNRERNRELEKARP
jgi:biopolymer transport protein ExbB/TolQ